MRACVCACMGSYDKRNLTLVGQLKVPYQYYLDCCFFNKFTREKDSLHFEKFQNTIRWMICLFLEKERERKRNTWTNLVGEWRSQSKFLHKKNRAFFKQ